MSETLVIYHGNCADGFTSAWVCHSVHPDWDYYPAVHGEPVPDTAGKRHIVLLDFSYKRDVMQAILDFPHIETVTILDHHKTAEKELEPLWDNPKLKGKFNMNHSGAYLAWEYFHGIKNIPYFVFYVEDRDLWKFKLNNSKSISQAIFSYEYTFQNWDMLNGRIENDIYSLISEGSAIERKHMKDINELLEKTRFQENIGGILVWSANLPYTMASDAAHILCGDDKTFGAVYWIDSKGNKVYSLRSKEDGMDVSEIAKQYGGGGHKNASGFTIYSGGSL